MKSIASYLIVLLALICQHAPAQTPHLWSFNQLYSFHPQSIYFLHEAKNGSIWIGTNEGLYSFDGVSLQKYIHPNFEFEYSNLQEDQHGRIWCANFSGQVFYTSHDSLKLFADLSSHVGDWTTFAVNHFPWIYMTTNKGMIRKHFENGTIEVMTLGDGFLEPKTIDLDTFSKRYWSQNLSSYSEQSVFNIGNQFIHFNPDLSYFITDFKARRTSSKVPAFVYSGERMWKVLKYKSGDLEIQKLEEAQWVKVFEKEGKNDGIQTLIALNDQELLAGTQHGLMHLRNINSPESSLKWTFQDKNIGSLLEDREGNIWIGTLGRGIFIYPGRGLGVFKAEAPCNHDQAFSFLEEGKEGEIFVVDEGNNVHRIHSANHSEPLVKVPYLVERLLFNPMSEKLYFYGYQSWFDLRKRKMGGLGAKSALKDFEVWENGMIVGAFSTVCQKFPKGFEEPELPINLRYKRSYHVKRGKVDGSFYVNYVDGVQYYQDSISKIIEWKGGPLIATTLSRSSQGGVWAGGPAGELFYLENGKARLVAKFKEAASKILTWKNQLFLATPSGLLRFNTQDSSSTLISKTDGLPTNQVVDMATLRDTLFMATNQGLFFVPCDYSSQITTPPLIRITKMEIMGKDTVLLPDYNLDHDQNFIGIRYAAVATRSQKTFSYRYRMLGQSDTWTEVPAAQDFVRFPALPPGNYTFEVMAVNENGIPSQEAARVAVNITAPFYQHPWFGGVIAFILLVLTAIYSYWRNQVHIRKEKEAHEKLLLEQELIGSQLSALRSQMNPHFIFNALNSIQDYILSNQKELAGDYLGKFANLMRVYLNHSKMETLSLSEEIKALRLYLDLEQVRFEENLEVSIEVASELDKDSIELPSLILQPFVENAIKHGLLHKKGMRKLRLSFAQQGDMLVCKVEDNGIGRSHSAEINARRHRKPSSHATSAIQQRITLLNRGLERKIEVTYHDKMEDGKPSGTLVEVLVPVA